MPDLWSLNLCVVDPQGGPVEMAAVSISASSHPVADVAACTSASGRVAIDVPSSGRYTITIVADKGRRASVEVEAVTDDAITTIALDDGEE